MIIDYAETLQKIKALERIAYKHAISGNTEELKRCADLFIEYATDLHIYCLSQTVKQA